MKKLQDAYQNFKSGMMNFTSTPAGKSFCIKSSCIAAVQKGNVKWRNKKNAKKQIECIIKDNSKGF